MRKNQKKFEREREIVSRGSQIHVKKEKRLVEQRTDRMDGEKQLNHFFTS